MFVGEVALLGDRRRFPAVLIVPNFTVLEDWARGHGLHTISREELIRSEKVRALYQEIVDELNANLAQFEKLKKVLLVPNELSMADGTLTPSMKLRRRKVEERYRGRSKRCTRRANVGLNRRRRGGAEGTLPIAPPPVSRRTPVIFPSVQQFRIFVAAL